MDLAWYGFRLARPARSELTDNIISAGTSFGPPRLTALQNHVCVQHLPWKPISLQCLAVCGAIQLLSCLYPRGSAEADLVASKGLKATAVSVSCEPARYLQPYGASQLALAAPAPSHRIHRGIRRECPLAAECIIPLGTRPAAFAPLSNGELPWRRNRTNASWKSMA